MKKTIRIMMSALLMSSLIACNHKAEETVENPTSNKLQEMETSVTSILTAEEQANMTADEIIERLKKGNQNFVNNNLTTRDHSEQRRLAAIGQYPKAIVLSCVDSRVPVEDVFDLGIGDIFVARVAGNIENADIVGSMEFATAVAGSKVIVVMGHTSCGAVHHAIDNTDAAGLGMVNLQNLLNEIRPVLDAHKNVVHSSKNTEFANMIIDENVAKTVADIKEVSPTLNKMHDDRKIKIIGAVYNMETGKVVFK
ncbi:carbonic anhydrase [Nonlabens sp. Ci31]|jgi:carbonic anhydrase|uniref:carbonic anhydrase family protein n=1 Tax=Nonlabens sp. Ci31 TaxID=2608253 RepID=UPI001464368B|nr:carbonic anhydrase family protein [Nonlabens sp. Ci31]QJP32940.1 carbonic anhydrase [Nonlabens sp. Ci31]